MSTTMIIYKKNYVLM